MAETLTIVAGGTIRPSRFIKLSTSENNTALEADAAEVTIGIAEEGTQDAPIPGGGTDAAADGEMLEYFPYGCKGKLELGTGGCTAGDLLKSDADGKGVTTTTNNDWFGAIALETGSAGELVDVICWGGYVGA